MLESRVVRKTGGQTPLLVHFVEQVGVVVADAGYRTSQLTRQLFECWQVFVLLPGRFKGSRLTDWHKHYNALAQTAQARWLYKQRKPSVEPVFTLIKDMFDLTAENQLPLRGLAKVKPYLMMSAFTVQLMMYYNFLHHKPLASTELFLADFK